MSNYPKQEAPSIENMPVMVGELNHLKTTLSIIEDTLMDVTRRIGYIDGQNYPSPLAEKAPEPKGLYDELCILSCRLNIIKSSVSEINERLRTQLG